MQSTQSLQLPSRIRSHADRERYGLLDEVPRRVPRESAAPSCPPTGYVLIKTPEGRSVEPEPVLASLVIGAFEGAAAGLRVRELLRIMTDKGLVSRHGHPMSVSSFWYLLTNAAYVGSTGYPPLVSPELFGRAQDGLHRRRRSYERKV